MGGKRLIVTYLRSSSYNCFGLCQQQYFLSYVLGLYQKPNFKAILGTIAHKVFECLGAGKQAIQNGDTIFVDDALGEVDIDRDRLYSPSFPFFLFEKAYKHYKDKNLMYTFKKKDEKDMKKWIEDTLNFQNGMFDPRNRKVVKPEQHFDFEIKKDWAKYSYTMLDGTSLDGHLAMKGTIDLITEVGPSHYEVIDWKGLPLNTPIPTLDGWKTMGEISVDDIVFDQHGKQCNVIGKSKVTQKQCYKITFDDKTEVKCDEDHLWKLYDKSVVNIKDLKVGNKIPVAKTHEIDNIEILLESLDIKTATKIKNKEEKFRQIINIEKGIIEKTQCIMVDSPDNTYLCTKHMIPTHNTGQRLNWATGKRKEYDDFQKDPQLRLYHYCIGNVFPDIDTFTMTIYYCRDGGPFTVSFCKDDLEETENMIRKKYEDIKKCVRPKLKSYQHKHFFCNRVCHYGKTPSEQDPSKSICQYIADKTRKEGIDFVIHEEKNPEFSIGYYQNPGE